MMKNHPHPGELLREDVLLPLKIEVTEAAHHLGMSRTALSRVINGHAGISPDLAVRLEKAGVSTARFWITLQANYELSLAEQREQPDIIRQPGYQAERRPLLQRCRAQWLNGDADSSPSTAT
jgi:addiction module HigA family antidote